jgi:hypothetical protein
MKKILIIFGCIISLLGLSCELDQEPVVLKTPGQIMDSNKYALLEIQHHIAGYSLNNGHFEVFIDGLHSYELNDKTGILSLSCNDVYKRDSIRKSGMICLFQTKIDKSIGGGLGEGFFKIDSLPYFIRFGKFVFSVKDSISFTGLNNEYVRINYNNKSIDLEYSSKKIILNEYIYTTGKIKYQIIDSLIIYNHGKYDKNKINFM